MYYGLCAPVHCVCVCAHMYLNHIHRTHTHTDLSVYMKRVVKMWCCFYRDAMKTSMCIVSDFFFFNLVFSSVVIQLCCITLMRSNSGKLFKILMHLVFGEREAH